MADKTIFDKLLEFETSRSQPDEHKKITKKESKVFIRAIPNPLASAEAQRLYNPNKGQTVRGPLAGQIEKGVSESLGTAGNWGTPE